MKTFEEAVRQVCSVVTVQDGETQESAVARLAELRKANIDSGRAARFDSVIAEAVAHYSTDVLALQLVAKVVNDTITGTQAIKMAFAQGVCVGMEMEKAEDPIL